MKIVLEISKEEDKNTVAAILFVNGYTVKKTKVVLNGRGKFVLEAFKEETKSDSARVGK